MYIKLFLSTLKLELGDNLKLAEKKLQEVSLEISEALDNQRSVSLVNQLTKQYAQWCSTRDTFKGCLGEVAEAEELEQQGSDRNNMQRYLDPIELAVHLQSHALWNEAPQLVTQGILKACRYARRQALSKR